MVRLTSILAAICLPVHAGELFTVHYPWHYDIVATEFYCGENARSAGGVSNKRSAYDSSWETHFGGVDDPTHRRNFAPVSFRPHLNPWYAAVPYTDVEHGHTKANAANIPWFRARYRRDGESVMVGSWIECRHDGRVCYLQIADCGPFHTDDFAYVFSGALPLPNRNHDAGIDLSPAAYQFLGLSDNATVSWRFVSSADVPVGPWRLYGDVAQVAP